MEQPSSHKSFWLMLFFHHAWIDGEFMCDETVNIKEP